MERYDIAIIGTGPAGLEAAITAKLRNKRILLLGSKNFSKKIEKAHTVKNYLGIPEASGEELRDAFSAHLAQMDISVTEDKVSCVYAMGDYFVVQGFLQMYEAKSVILACGMPLSNPLPGEESYLGRGVSYCATCDGLLYRDKTVVVIADSPEDEKDANYLAEIAKKVIYISGYKGQNNLDERIETMRDIVPQSIEAGENAFVLKTDRESILADGIFILREAAAPGQLVPGLALTEGAVAVDRGMRTNLPGLFACGDITGAPYQYSKAAGEGNVAALSAVSYLAEQGKER